MEEVSAGQVRRSVTKKRPAAAPEDYHRRHPSTRELRQIFRLETERGINNDWCVLHNGRILQLQPQKCHYGSTRAKELMCEPEDGTTEVFYRHEELPNGCAAKPA